MVYSKLFKGVILYEYWLLKANTTSTLYDPQMDLKNYTEEIKICFKFSIIHFKIFVKSI